jgi:aryl-alcohol dehydrogenase-like predicted oxidoreductase
LDLERCDVELRFMQLRYLGQTGVLVSELCLGAMTFGREADEASTQAMLDRFLEVGGNFVDTANVYAEGRSEELIGRWLTERGNRDDLVLATKVRFATGEGPNDVGLSRKHVLRAVHASLRRLATDYVDLLQIHTWDPGTPLEETLRTLDQLVREGLVRYVGASNLTGWQLERSLQLARTQGCEPFTTLQPQYNLLSRGIEWEVLPVCAEYGVGVIPWGPLAGGWLTGKHRPSGPASGSRVVSALPEHAEAWERRAEERTWAVLRVVQEIAEKHGASPAQVALNWLRAKPLVTAPILGARSMEQLEDNLGCVDWQLSSEEVTQLDKVSTVETFYPYDFIDNASAQRLQPVSRGTG